jgi:drug/metabolite transporter (DMT)-like permease
VAVVGPGIGSLFLHLMPALTPLFAFIFLGERPAWYHAVGIVSILAGILLATGRVRVPQSRNERA